MSHELRTPLNAVLGFTGTILLGLSGPLTDKQKHQLSIINDVLDVAKIESGEVEVEFEPVDCCEVLDEVVSAMRPLADAKGIELEMSAAERFELEGHTNNGPVACFSVIDTGIGIKVEDREKLFTAFQQVELSATRRFEGTGLGLFISQKLALLIDAKISFESDYGAGSTFTLELSEAS